MDRDRLGGQQGALGQLAAPGQVAAERAGHQRRDDVVDGDAVGGADRLDPASDTSTKATERSAVRVALNEVRGALKGMAIGALPVARGWPSARRRCTTLAMVDGMSLAISTGSEAARRMARPGHLEGTGHDGGGGALVDLGRLALGGEVEEGAQADWPR